MIRFVKLTYFKPNGKYYSDGNYYTDDSKEMFEIWDEVKQWIKMKALPCLSQGNSDFIVSIDVPSHPNNHPHLIIGS